MTQNIAILVYIIVIAVCSFLMFRSQSVFYKKYRSSIDPNLSHPGNLDQSNASPMGAFTQSRRLLRIIGEVQSDPTIERLRRRSVFWRRVTIAAIFSGPLLMVLLRITNRLA